MMRLPFYFRNIQCVGFFCTLRAYIENRERFKIYLIVAPYIAYSQELTFDNKLFLKQ